MKLTVQMLRSRAGGPLNSIEYIDLSRLNLGNFDRISSCPKLQTVNLSYNDIVYVSCLDTCSELSKIDLHNNKLCNLEGLTRFVALGFLILSNNNLNWPELAKIRQMHILNLSLHGNPQLEKDPYYRIHVIDCLPNVWMLDGRIITSGERTQVGNFFEESAMTDRPIRHKLGKETFIPSFRQKLEVTGIFGKRTDHLMRRFPRNCSLNIETDHRRISYLAWDLQQDFLVESKYISNRNWSALKHNNSCIEEVLDIRTDDRVRCNMLLLLLVASLEFAIPSHLMQEALTCTKLDLIGDVETMELFLLPKEVRCYIVSLLLSSVKVDKDAGEEGGLYDKLYLCLYHSVSELTRLSQGGVRQAPNKHTIASEKTNKCLIASEVVQLMCIVPAFFDYMTKDSGVMNLVTMATSDIQFVDRIEKLMTKMEKNQWELKRIYENVAEVTLRAIQENTASLVVKKPKTDDNYVLNTRKVATKRPQSSPIFASQYHMIGRTSPDKKPVRIKTGKPYRGSYIPQAQLGEKVLLGPQNIARVISIPEPELVLVQMDIVPDESGAMISNRKTPEEHYKYMDMKNLYWDYLGNYWRPKGTIGDRITMQTKDEKEQQELITQAQKLATKDSLTNVLKAHSPRVFGGTLYTENRAAVEEPPKRNKADIPRAVSAKYKESHHLQLELNDDDNRRVGKHKEEQGISPSSPQDRVDVDQYDNHVPPPSRAKSARPASQSNCIEDTNKTKPTLSEKDDGEEDELLYSHSQLSRNSPRSSLESLEEPELKDFEESQPGTRPSTSKMKRKDQHEQEGDNSSPRGGSRGSAASETAIEIPQVDVESQGTTARTVSDLNSAKKPVHDDSSRPDVIPESESMSLQGSGDGTQPSLTENMYQQEMVSKLEDDDIDHDKQEVDTLEYSTTFNGTKENTSNFDLISSTTTGNSSSKHQLDVSEAGAVCGSTDDRPPSAGFSGKTSVTTRNIELQDEHAQQKNNGNDLKYGSYHMPRPGSGYDQYTHAKLDNHTNGFINFKRQDIAEYESVPPPQRPPSPFLHRSGKKSNITVQHGQTWLGGGRDLHWEKKIARPKSGHNPGWKEGLPSRPKSAAAVRALKRSKTPNIMTPSSMAFDDLYGRNAVNNLSKSDLSQYQVQYHEYDVSLSAKQQQQLQQQATYSHSTGAPRRYARKEEAELVIRNQYNGDPIPFLIGDEDCVQSDNEDAVELYDLRSSSSTPQSQQLHISLLASTIYPKNKAQWQYVHGPIKDVHVTGHHIMHKVESSGRDVIVHNEPGLL